MASRKTGSAAVGTRGEPLRRRVLDAAERLLRRGGAEFSMRDLADEAQVSFATPFNQFGGKAAIMHALSDRRIDAMQARFVGAPPEGDAADRIAFALDIAVAVMLEEPEVSRAVMGWLGTAGPAPARARARSTALWTLALGEGDGLVAARRDEALRRLPGHLAFAFRGMLSFWTAGELSDEALAHEARAVADTMLRGYVGRRRSGECGL